MILVLWPVLFLNDLLSAETFLGSRLTVENHEELLCEIIAGGSYHCKPLTHRNAGFEPAQNLRSDFVE